MTKRCSFWAGLPAFVATFVVALWPQVAAADSVMLDGFWFDRITAGDIVDGCLVYKLSNGSERVKPLSEVQGLKLTAFDASAAAYDALNARDYEKALECFSAIVVEARQPWIKHWATWHKMTALDELARPAEAVEAYLSLAREKADPYFLTKPPLKSLRNAPDDQKKGIASRLRVLRKRMGTGPAKKPFDQMLAELNPARKPKGDSTVADPNDAGSPTTPDDSSGGSAASGDSGGSAKSESAAVMTTSIDANDPVTRLLHAGQFEKALAETDQLIAGKELRLAMRLYQRGLAQLYLAERSDNRRLFLDAGLSFMRLAIYFRKSSYTGPALVEAGVVHERIGRHELAMKLWRKAQVEIDPETDPAVAQRLEIMLGGTDR